MGSGDDSNIDFSAEALSDPTDLRLLENPQELALFGQGQIADLIEENGSSGGGFEDSGAIPSAPVNEPFTCPKRSECTSVSDRAAQLTGTKGPDFRGLDSWAR